VLTDDHSPYRRLVKDPSGGDVRDADPPATVPNRSQDREQFLKERPVAPRLQDHIEVLKPFPGRKNRGTEGVVNCRNNRIERNKVRVS